MLLNMYLIQVNLALSELTTLQRDRFLKVKCQKNASVFIATCIWFGENYAMSVKIPSC